MSQQVFPEEALAVVREVHHGGGEGHLVAAVDSVGGEVVDGEHTNYFQPFPLFVYFVSPMFCDVFTEFAIRPVALVLAMDPDAFGFVGQAVATTSKIFWKSFLCDF